MEKQSRESPQLRCRWSEELSKQVGNAQMCDRQNTGHVASAEEEMLLGHTPATTLASPSLPPIPCVAVRVFVMVSLLLMMMLLPIVV